MAKERNTPWGFISADGRPHVTRCMKCGLENYALAVSSGQCVWCGWEPTEEDMTEHRIMKQREGE